MQWHSRAPEEKTNPVPLLKISLRPTYLDIMTALEDGKPARVGAILRAAKTTRKTFFEWLKFAKEMHIVDVEAAKGKRGPVYIYSLNADGHKWMQKITEVDEFGAELRKKAG